MAQATGMLRASDPLASSRVWIGLNTIILRECAVIARFWTVTLAPPVMTTLLYFAVFGDILGKRIGSFAGIDYIHYIAPGLIALWVIPYAFGHTASGFLGARIFKFLEEILVTPAPHWAVMLGYVTGGVTRGFLVGAAAAITTLLFTHIHVKSVLITVAALALAALVSSLGGFITWPVEKESEGSWRPNDPSRFVNPVPQLNQVPSAVNRYRAENPITQSTTNSGPMKRAHST